MKTLYFKHALLPDGWANNVSVEVDSYGNIAQVVTDGRTNEAVSGCLLPGIANLHSHAHQRAMAGLAEKAGPSSDSFWTWRDVMYRHLAKIKPDQLHAIAAQLYVEMLKSGYTRVAEFQYLHHQPNGSRYECIAEMSLQTLTAASEVGIGITSLPVLYQFSGFGGQAISDQQRRFANGPEHFLQIVDALMRASRGDANVNTGIAAHSLRAVTVESFSEVLDEFSNRVSLPVHIHIAEQTCEVDDCISWSGAGPVEYLYDNFPVNQHWCLIHATHLSENEIRRITASGAVVGLCPTTEANLGDGFFDAKSYLAAGGQFGIGSDSHISMSPTEELRWLEYGQRLIHHSRNQLSAGPLSSTGSNLFNMALAGGAQACGHKSGSIAPGHRADFIVLDCDHPLLCERSGDELIDSWIFSGNQNTVRNVFVGGRQVIDNGHHLNEDSIQHAFKKTLRELRE